MAPRYLSAIARVAICLLITGLLPEAVAGQAGDRVSSLTVSLKDPNVKTRITAADALGSIGDRRAVEPLLEALQTAEEEALAELNAPPLVGVVSAADIAKRQERRAELEAFRSQTVHALGRIGDARAFAPLVSLMVRGVVPDAAASALMLLKGPLTDPGAIRSLIGVLSRDNFSARASAERVLRKVGAAAVDPLIERVETRNNTPAQKIAAGLLAEIRDPRGQAALERAWQADDLSAVIGGHSYFIRKGTPSTEAKLISALEFDGDARAAVSFINSGNPKLSAAGRAWASRHGYTIVQQRRDGLPRWGGSRP